MFKKFVTALVTSAFIGLAGCATQNSGPLVPDTNAGSDLSKLIGTNVLMDDPTVLTIYATTYCNVAAAQEYRLSVAACAGNLVKMIPGFVMPPQAVSGVQIACNILGYTDANNQLLSTVPPTIAVGPVSACTAPAAKITAPLGQKLIIPLNELK